MNLNFPILKFDIPTPTQQIQQLNLEKNNPIEEKLTNQFSEDLRINHGSLLKNFEYMSKDLLSMGYQPRIVTNSFLAFKYKNTAEAIEIIDKTELSLWNHKFILSDKNFCFVCGDIENNHKSLQNVLKKKNTENINENLSLNNSFKDIYKQKSFGKINTIIAFPENQNRNDYYKNKICNESLINTNIFNSNTNEDLIYNDKELEKEKSDDNEELICPICFFKIEDGKNFNLECNHKFCKECIDEYLKEEIKNSRVLNIKCPQKDCEKLFNEDKIKEILNEEFLYKYKKFLLREKYKNNSNYVICPIVNCEGYAEKNQLNKMDNSYNLVRENKNNKNSNFINQENITKGKVLDNEIDKILDLDKNNNKISSEQIINKDLIKVWGKENSDVKKKLICTYKHELCSECNQAWHGDSNCEEDKEIKDFARFSGIIPKKCPNCKVWTEKNLGCNHMKCKICSYNWCWLCSQECPEDHYLNPGPCQGKQFDEGEINNMQENVLIARLLYTYRNNPLIYYIVFPLLLFFTFNNMIHTLLSPQYQRNRRNRRDDNLLNNQNQRNPNVNINLGNPSEVNNGNEVKKEIIDSQLNIQNNNNNFNNNANNQGEPVNANNNLLLNNDLEMNNYINQNNDNNDHMELGCCEKFCTKILLIFSITMMSIIFMIIFVTFNMFNMMPITMLLGRFERNANGFVKCLALGTYMIYFLISYPLGAGITVVYFGVLYVLCILKIIIY